jgi:CDGSH-type Zn-finger protein
MSGDAEIGGREPIAVEVEEGKIYWWCACGRSKNQPFCDGSHKGTEFVPQGWEAPENRQGLLLRLQTDRQEPPVRRQP